MAKADERIYKHDLMNSHLPSKVGRIGGPFVE